MKFCRNKNLLTIRIIPGGGGQGSASSSSAWRGLSEVGFHSAPLVQDPPLEEHQCSPSPGLHVEAALHRESRFDVQSGRFVYGCGAFFALKIVSAKTLQQLEEFAKEAENLEKLRGHANIVQIRDHSIMHSTLHVVILMELAACDLQHFFRRFQYSFPVSTTFSIWRSLVNAVDAAHGKEIIHRDLKPGNFLLVPVGPGAEIIATTKIPADKFKFRVAKNQTVVDAERTTSAETTTPPGDVELILTDPTTGAEQILPLIIKLSDFGLAEPLDLDASHFSVLGHAGTIKYMAPETFRPCADGIQRLSKRVDIWALGMMLFQMLHSGRTPFDRFFCTNGNNIRAAVAIASEFIHVDVMKFDRRGVWAGEAKKLQEEFANKSLGQDAGAGQVVFSLLATEFLFRICETCLAFESTDRVDAGNLKSWVGDLLDGQWREQTMRALSAVEVQALVSGISTSTLSGLDEHEQTARRDPKLVGRDFVSEEEDGSRKPAATPPKPDEGGPEDFLQKPEQVPWTSELDENNLVEHGGERMERLFFPELQRCAAAAKRRRTGRISLEDRIRAISRRARPAKRALVESSCTDSPTFQERRRVGAGGSASSGGHHSPEEELEKPRWQEASTLSRGLRIHGEAGACRSGVERRPLCADHDHDRRSRSGRRRSRSGRSNRRSIIAIVIGISLAILAGVGLVFFLCQTRPARSAEDEDHSPEDSCDSTPGNFLDANPTSNCSEGINVPPLSGINVPSEPSPSGGGPAGSTSSPTLQPPTTGPGPLLAAPAWSTGPPPSAPSAASRGAPPPHPVSHQKM